MNNKRLLTLVSISVLYIELVLIMEMRLTHSPTARTIQALDPDNPSFLHLSRPFVSLVVLGERNQTSKWKSFSPQSLVLEVLEGTSQQPAGELTVLINPKADPVGDDFLAYLVREALVRIKTNPRAVVAPVVEIDGLPYTHAVLWNTQVRRFFEDRLEKIPVLPALGALALKTSEIQLLTRVLSGWMVEGSEDIWKCSGEIFLAKLSKMRILGAPPVQQAEDAPSCAGNFSKDLFSDWLPPLKNFRLTFGEDCLIVVSSREINITTCSSNNSQSQLFVWSQAGRALRSVHSCELTTHPACLCLQAQLPSPQGTTVHLGVCRPNSPGQEFQLHDGFLVWGSFCVNEKMQFSTCEESSRKFSLAYF